jgi:hypothetical protein
VVDDKLGCGFQFVETLEESWIGGSAHAVRRRMGDLRHHEVRANLETLEGSAQRNGPGQTLRLILFST